MDNDRQAMNRAVVVLRMDGTRAGNVRCVNKKRLSFLTGIAAVTLLGSATCGRVVGPTDGGADGSDVSPPVDAVAEIFVEVSGDAPLGEAAPEAPAFEAAPSRCPVERAIVDRPDDSPLDQVRALYVLPADGEDQRLDVNGRICASLEAAQHWLAGQTVGAHLRLDTSAGQLDVGFVRLPVTDARLRGSGGDSLATGFAYLRDRLERELVAQGLLAAHKLYAVYYGGSSALGCGGGAWPPDLPGHVAALYLAGEPAGARPCASNPLGASPQVPGYLDYAMLHEILHTLGLVPAGAPNEHARGHVFDEAAGPTGAARDLMYAGRSAGDPPWATGSPQGLQLDVGGDDYFGHGRAQPDLARSSFMDPLPPGGGERPPRW
jgi:hypothetical protein